MTKINLAQDFNYSYDLVNSFLGNLIAEGTTRIVYECELYPEFVIKVDKYDGSYNRLEYEFYQAIIYQDSSKWFAPCTWISDNGKFMIQKKVKPIIDKNKKNIPKMIPAFLTDVKFNNFGFLNGKFVCVDYVGASLVCMSQHPKRMKKFKSHLGEVL